MRRAPILLACLAAACGARTGVRLPPESDGGAAAHDHDLGLPVLDGGPRDLGAPALDGGAPMIDAGIPARTHSLATAGSHSCATDATGALWCWGRSGFGTLGDGTITDRLTPVRVTGLAGVRDVSTASATCATTAAGLSCWGDDRAAELDEAAPTVLCGGWTCATAPLAVTSVLAAVQVSTNGHTCARVASGDVLCWGDNSAGQLGDGTTTGRATPAPVAGLHDAIAVTAAGGFTCAVRLGGTVVCWGSNAAGALGDGTTVPLRTTPVPVVGLADAVDVATGAEHACALRASGAVVCWGNNHGGELGDGTTTNSNVPVAVVGLDDAVGVAAGSFHSCALRRSGGIVCWGLNGSGELGTGTTDASSVVPVPVVGLDDAIELAAGGPRTCARRRGGAIVCWGAGPLGDGSTASSAMPVAVAGFP